MFNVTSCFHLYSREEPSLVLLQLGAFTWTVARPLQRGHAPFLLQNEAMALFFFSTAQLWIPVITLRIEHSALGGRRRPNMYICTSHRNAYRLQVGMRSTLIVRASK
jgi:hypothetical protein